VQAFLEVATNLPVKSNVSKLGAAQELKLALAVNKLRPGIIFLPWLV